MKPAALALFTVTLGAGPALAQTQAERSACTPDVWRLCSAEIPNAEAITHCLRHQRSRLSVACRTVMDEAGAAPVRTVSNRP